jgi:hypothetical protein
MMQSNTTLTYLSPLIFLSVVFKSNEGQSDALHITRSGDPAVKLFPVVAAKNCA